MDSNLTDVGDRTTYFTSAIFKGGQNSKGGKLNTPLSLEIEIIFGNNHRSPLENEPHGLKWKMFRIKLHFADIWLVPLGRISINQIHRQTAFNLWSMHFVVE